MRTFETGATRDSDADKPDYEGFMSPLAVRRFGRYMSKHRVQADGNIRASDNWQKGIPQDQYLKSLWRHLVDVWTLHRGNAVRDTKGNVVDVEDALCAIIFNAQGYLHEHLKNRPAAATKTLTEAAAEGHPWWESLPEGHPIRNQILQTKRRTADEEADADADRDLIIKELRRRGLSW